MGDGTNPEPGAVVEALARIAADPRDPVRAYVRRLARGDAWEAEDLLQEALLRALSGAATARPGACARRWLRGIVRHVWKDARRRDGRVVLAPTDAAQSEDDPAGALERRDAHERIRRALCDLRPRERHVLWLHGHGRTVSEIAAVRGEHPEKTKSILRRSRRALARRLRTGGTAARA